MKSDTFENLQQTDKNMESFFSDKTEFKTNIFEKYASREALSKKIKKQHKEELRRKQPAEKSEHNLSVEADFADKKEDKPKAQQLKSLNWTPTLQKEITFAWMAEMILSKLTIIIYNERLYYFSGRSYVQIPDTEALVKLIREHVSENVFGVSQISKKISDLYLYLKSDGRLVPKDIRVKEYEAKHLVCFKNGVYDVRSDSLRNHSKDFLIFNELDANFIKEAKPKVFKQFLDDVSGGAPEIKRRIVEMTGYCYFNNNLARCFFVLGTASRAGKSTLMQFITESLGEANVENVPVHKLSNQFALGTIENKLVNMHADLPNGKLNSVAVSTLKGITGGDKLNIEAKYQTPRNIKANVRFLLGTNYPLNVAMEDSDFSFWDRVVLVPFLYSVSPEEADLRLLDKLLAENDRIVSYCVQEFRKVVVNNYRFSKCTVADDMLEQWKTGQSFIMRSLNEFLADCVCVTGDEKDYIFSTRLYEVYVDWCEMNNQTPLHFEGAISSLKNNLPSEVTKKRIHNKHSENPRAAFVGMRLSQETGNEDIEEALV